MIETNRTEHPGDNGAGLRFEKTAPFGSEMRQSDIPLVSICVPHLNSAPFTEERMKTILSQTLSNWELFVFDSKSDDGSRGILQRHADGDPRIRLIDVPRDGIYPSVNRALKLCTGEYV